MPRFVILAHDHPTPHWDLFLEAGPVLRSWRLTQPLANQVPINVELTPDHRLDYLEYEGPISGDRGSVARVDSGEFSWERDIPDNVVVRLVGQTFVGELSISRSESFWTGRFHSE
jgi:DNA polymerase Ligase (LigD)